MADLAALVQDLRRLPGRLSLASAANYTQVVPEAPVTHDLAIAERRPNGTWSIACECGDTIPAATESAAWAAFEAHAGAWLMPRTPRGGVRP